MLTCDMPVHHVALLAATNELEHEQNTTLYMDHKDVRNEIDNNV